MMKNCFQMNAFIDFCIYNFPENTFKIFFGIPWWIIPEVCISGRSQLLKGFLIKFLEKFFWFKSDKPKSLNFQNNSEIFLKCHRQLQGNPDNYLELVELLKLIRIFETLRQDFRKKSATSKRNQQICKTIRSFTKRICCKFHWKLY